MEDGAGASERLAELIRMSFRATYILATNMRNEMLDAGREEELDEFVATARALQAKVLGGASE